MFPTLSKFYAKIKPNRKQALTLACLVYLLGLAGGYVLRQLAMRSFVPSDTFDGARVNLLPFHNVFAWAFAPNRLDLSVETPWFLWFGEPMEVAYLCVNILAFVPLGIFFVLLAKDAKNVKYFALIAFALPFFFEWTQGALHIGACDIDSVLQRAAGAFLGYGFASTRITEAKPSTGAVLLEKC